jgi:hypothetical protein
MPLLGGISSGSFYALKNAVLSHDVAVFAMNGRLGRNSQHRAPASRIEEVPVQLSGLLDAHQPD